MLEESGCQVFLVNMLDCVLMTKPLALLDFILSLMAALTSEVEKSSDKDLKPLSSSDWERLQKFPNTEISLKDIKVEVKGTGAAAQLGFKLKTDPEFKARIQKHLEGHLTHLVQEAQEFAVALLAKIRAIANDPDKKVVLLVDSLEQLRGAGEKAAKIYANVVEVFFGQSANLAFPQLHVVYTVPPYLPVLAHNLGRTSGGPPVSQCSNIHVRDRKGSPDQTGLAIMEKIIEKQVALKTEKDLPDLARFLDSNLIMNYLNGEPWYDVHPLLIEEIESRAAVKGESPIMCKTRSRHSLNHSHLPSTKALWFKNGNV